MEEFLRIEVIKIKQILCDKQQNRSKTQPKLTMSEASLAALAQARRDLDRLDTIYDEIEQKLPGMWEQIREIRARLQIGQRTSSSVRYVGTHALNGGTG